MFCEYENLANHLFPWQGVNSMMLFSIFVNIVKDCFFVSENLHKSRGEATDVTFYQGIYL